MNNQLIVEASEDSDSDKEGKNCFRNFYLCLTLAPVKHRINGWMISVRKWMSHSSADENYANEREHLFWCYDNLSPCHKTYLSEGFSILFKSNLWVPLGPQDATNGLSLNLAILNLALLFNTSSLISQSHNMLHWSIRHNDVFSGWNRVYNFDVLTINE